MGLGLGIVGAGRNLDPLDAGQRLRELRLAGTELLEQLSLFASAEDLDRRAVESGETIVLGRLLTGTHRLSFHTNGAPRRRHHWAAPWRSSRVGGETLPDSADTFPATEDVEANCRANSARMIIRSPNAV